MMFFSRRLWMWTLVALPRYYAPMLRGAIKLNVVMTTKNRNNRFLIDASFKKKSVNSRVELPKRTWRRGFSSYCCLSDNTRAVWFCRGDRRSAGFLGVGLRGLGQGDGAVVESSADRLEPEPSLTAFCSSLSPSHLGYMSSGSSYRNVNCKQHNWFHGDFGGAPRSLSEGCVFLPI